MENENEEVIDDVIEDSTIEGQDEVLDVPSYEPDFGYSIKDEKLEFDERLRGSVKSKEDEDYIRDLYTKAGGLDEYKTKYADVESQAQNLIGGYEKLQSMRDGNDIRGIQKALGLTDDQILDYATALLDEDELPSEQKEVIQSNRKMQDELTDLRSKVNSFESQQSMSRKDSEVNGLKTMVSSDRYRGVNDAMAAVGHNMFDEVMMRGTHQFKVTGQEPSVQSIVDQVASQFAYLSKEQTTEENKQVLPSVRGTNTAPVKSEISSLDDLRKLASQIAV